MKSQAGQVPQEILSFPCEIMIKAMGLAEDGFEMLVVQLVRVHVPNLGENDFTSRPSSGGKYLSVSVRVQAENRTQMDAIYRDLSAHHKVLMAL
ncbi:MAG: transcriptional regulator [Gammaproteobacteria bacterium RIFOXYA12_FULL_61_12]|nr:MAG: transcriptional regulator [Gammaproteobacteria bacterium RIFOXYD12_FULL_61_37]OGT94620.1 MAG: transcriptional regulator [Gammaproteobacteria bacterium RIFOXYA12_FULL_61_12]